MHAVRSKPRPPVRGWLLIVLSATLALGIAELGLRALGYEPFRYQTVDRHEPTLHEPHPRLGWRNKPGRYVYPAYAPGAPDITVTFLTDHTRAAEPEQIAPPSPAEDSRPELLLLGGSFTQGAAIADHETFARRLQERFPLLRVRNFGTGGYGTYQSLLALEMELPASRSPRLVVYGYISDHRARNVAGWRWLAVLSQYSRRGHVFVPFVSSDEKGRLRRHRPQRYPAWPLHEALATVALAEQIFAQLREGRRADHEDAVLRALLAEMQSLCAAHGASLLVVLLNAWPEDKQRVLSFLQARGIAAADCAFPIPLDQVVAGEGVHPNGRMHDLYARCAGDAVASLLERR